MKHSYKPPKNPLEPVLQILEFEVGQQNFLPLYNKGESTDHMLSVYPEYSHVAKAYYGFDELSFNCAIQRDGENHHFVEFVDEVDFWKFLADYDPNHDYKQEEQDALDKIRLKS